MGAMRAAIFSAVLALTACMNTPAVREAGRNHVPLGDFPAGAERVEIDTGRGEMLRGLWVPAGPEAPIVLQFCESGGSITDGTGGWGYPVAWELRGAGMSLLCVDYRGVGASDGDASQDNLAADARAAWTEALRRAGGDPQRIVLRGLSLGTFAISYLLDEGVRPGAIVIAAPVRAETIVKNVADHWADDHAFQAFLARVFLRRPAATDVVAALAQSTAPTLALMGEDDAYLPPPERKLIRDALDRPGGEPVTWPSQDHVDTVRRAHELTDEERAFYQRLFPQRRSRQGIARVLAQLPDRFPPGSSARQRLELLTRSFYFEPPRLAAAIALAWDPVQLVKQDAAITWIRRTDRKLIEQAPIDALVALLSFEDPAGALAPIELASWRYWVHENAVNFSPEALRAKILVSGRHHIAFFGTIMKERHPWGLVGFGFDARESELPDMAPGRLRLPEPERLRQAWLLALKAQGVPARTRDGKVEVWEPKTGWRVTTPPDTP